MFYALGKKKLYLRQMMKHRIHKALQLEVCDQCNQKLSKGRLKVSQIDFLYLLLPWTFPASLIDSTGNWNLFEIRTD